jgi:hypothetical protein
LIVQPEKEGKFVEGGRLIEIVHIRDKTQQMRNREQGKSATSWAGTKTQMREEGGMRKKNKGEKYGIRGRKRRAGIRRIG